MSVEKSLRDVLRDVVDLLESNDIPYMLMGGFAVRFWGIPRPTYDIDLTISLEREQLPNLCAAAESRGFAVPEIHLKGFTDTLKEMNKISFQSFALGTVIPVDLFLVTTEYQRSAFSRRSRRELDGRPLWMISPEDLVLHKLIAGREKDMSDVGDILLVAGTLDTTYLKTWARHLGVVETLDRKLNEQI